MNSDYLKCNCFNERKTCINTCVCGTVLTSFYLKFSRNDLFCWSPHSFLHTCIFYNLVDSAECCAHVVMLLQTQRSFSLPSDPFNPGQMSLSLFFLNSFKCLSRTCAQSAVSQWTYFMLPACCQPTWTLFVDSWCVCEWDTVRVVDWIRPFDLKSELLLF